MNAIKQVLYLSAYIFYILVSTYGSKPIYSCELDRYVIENYDKNIIYSAGNVTIYNRTTRVFNLELTFLKNIANSARVTVEIFILKDNSYKLTNMQTSFKLRDVLSYTFFDLKRMFDEMTPPLRMPIQVKTKYQLVNFIPDESKFPKYLPEAKFKLKIDCFVDEFKTWYCTSCLYGSLKYKM